MCTQRAIIVHIDKQGSGNDNRDGPRTGGDWREETLFPRVSRRSRSKGHDVATSILAVLRARVIRETE